MKNAPTAAVLLIGDELLAGSIQDENLGYIAKLLAERGIRVRESRVVADEEKAIVDALNALRKTYDHVFTTGGIGPTHDDITSDSVAVAFGVKNVIQQDVFDTIANYLDGKGVEFTPAAQRMAYAPEGAEMIWTGESVVPGYRIENVYVMAGVPSIMRVMMGAIIDTLGYSEAIQERKVHANVSEGEIAAALTEIQQHHSDVAIGSYPQQPDSSISKYRVIFIVRGTDLQRIEACCDAIMQACDAGGYAAMLEHKTRGPN
ncbi:MAG: competence/damage-inducible protein A [Gammaproteobacteria bacterium]|nr:competence/damage-inducible protein A [Gammaproteobacteria bacterium]